MRGGIPFEDWEGLVPPPSIHELIDTLSGGNQFLKEASGEFAWAERTLRRIAAKDDTEMIPVITDDGGEPNG
ncbi:MAG TPA: hypothetical protein VFQ06_15535 [Nitrospira sp.]|nr:hypothetical protein [Nitrospira sp.]